MMSSFCNGNSCKPIIRERSGKGSTVSVVTFHDDLRGSMEWRELPEDGQDDEKYLR